ncbi:ATP synthase F1 subcomplex epsilon subunit [Rhodovulum sp. ES.010]|uniref:F0F1 ATP synthase subunit epsilon n=1 Tax=Rhodovulum sp. ES.010 TaxID=1882821 RepID=UPI00092B62DD|nr:F0F1 ATP synthase subunit epsilon [Rhodovulum sp. ES.010]SIO45541.1 ATP synthase F1 subcomplex epsilon subunit [Rhodovulum sp. ES.010]
MADTMQFDLVAPERRVASEQATQVVVPGFEGDLTAMPQHVPMITTLRPGILEVFTDKGSRKFAVTGGFAEIAADSATVLAERSLPVEDVTKEMLDEWVAEARAAHEEAHPDVVDASAKMLADMVAMGTHMGFEPST